MPNSKSIIIQVAYPGWGPKGFTIGHVAIAINTPDGFIYRGFGPVDVFDANYNGKLDAGDAQRNKFKVLVTNADGTTARETISQLGIMSINLSIGNETRARVDESEILSAKNGDGLIDQAETITAGANGSTIDTVSDPNGDGSLKDRVVTTASGNGLSTAIQRDTTGAGSFDQTDTDVVVLNVDGSRAETCLNGGGTFRYKTVTVSMPSRRRNSRRLTRPKTSGTTTRRCKRTVRIARIYRGNA